MSTVKVNNLGNKEEITYEMYNKEEVLERIRSNKEDIKKLLDYASSTDNAEMKLLSKNKINLLEYDISIHETLLNTVEDSFTMALDK